MAHARGQYRHLNAFHTASALVLGQPSTWYHEFRSTAIQNTISGFGSKLNEYLCFSYMSHFNFKEPFPVLLRTTISFACHLD